MDIFAKIFNGWKPLTIFTKMSILDGWQDSDYTNALRAKMKVATLKLQISSRTKISKSYVLQKTLSSIFWNVLMLWLVKRNKLQMRHIYLANTLWSLYYADLIEEGSSSDSLQKRRLYKYLDSFTSIRWRLSSDISDQVLQDLESKIFKVKVYWAVSLPLALNYVN